MNEKKAKKLRRSLMTHDEWLREKAKRTYVFVDFDSKPRKGNKILFRTATNDIQMGIVIKRDGDEYEVKAGNDIFRVMLDAIRPSRVACALDKISLYKEAKKNASPKS
jgi:hypothetical protein